MRKKNLFKEFDEVQNYIGRSNARYYIWKLTDTLEQIKFIGTIDPYLEKVIEDLRNKVQKVTGKEAPFKIKYGTNSKKCNRIGIFAISMRRF